MFKQNFLCSKLCLLPFVLSQETPLRKAWLHLLFCSHWVFMHIDKIPSKLLFPQPLLVYQLLQVLNCFRGLHSCQFMAWTGLMPVCPWVFCPEGAQNWTQDSRCVTPMLSRSAGSPLSTCWETIRLLCHKPVIQSASEWQHNHLCVQNLRIF